MPGMWTYRMAGLAAVAAAARGIARSRRRIDFSGRSILISGGSRGLGLVMARQFAAEGAKLTLLARDADELQRAEEDLRRRRAPGVLTIACDVTDPLQVDMAIAQAVERYGRIDVAINNAGIIQCGPVEHMDYEDFRQSLNIHVWAPLYVMNGVVPVMRKMGGGRIVNISSIGGRVAVPHLVPYSTGKFALTGLSDGMRSELAKDRIYVTTVCPGLMRTGSPGQGFFKGQQRKEFTAFAISDSLPLVTIDAGRAGRQILEACRFGDPKLTITLAAKLAALADTVAPGLTASAFALVNRLLPGPVGSEGDVAIQGKLCGTALAPSPLTVLSNRAAENNNEL